MQYVAKYLFTVGCILFIKFSEYNICLSYMILFSFLQAITYLKFLNTKYLH